MSRSIIARTSFLSLEYDDKRNFLYANWKGYVAVSQVKEGGEMILEAVRQTRCTRLLNDNRELQGTWTQALQWIVNENLPLLLEMGLRKIAFIYSPDRAARYSVDRLLELNDQYTAQTFEDYPAAEQWLLTDQSTPYVPPAAISGKLTIRVQERYLLVDFHEIYYLSSSHRETLLHTQSGTYSVRETLKELLPKLPPVHFKQIHRSHIVNLRKIAHLKYYAGGSYTLFLEDLPGIRIPVGRSYALDLKRRLGIDPAE